MAKMGGARTYTNEEIMFVLQKIVRDEHPDDIIAAFRATFPDCKKDFKQPQFDYIKATYGTHPDFGCILYNTPRPRGAPPLGSRRKRGNVDDEYQPGRGRDRAPAAPPVLRPRRMGDEGYLIPFPPEDYEPPRARFPNSSHVQPLHYPDGVERPPVPALPEYQQPEQQQEQRLLPDDDPFDFDQGMLTIKAEPSSDYPLLPGWMSESEDADESKNATAEQLLAAPQHAEAQMPSFTDFSFSPTFGQSNMLSGQAGVSPVGMPHGPLSFDPTFAWMDVPDGPPATEHHQLANTFFTSPLTMSMPAAPPNSPTDDRLPPWAPATAESSSSGAHRSGMQVPQASMNPMHIDPYLLSLPPPSAGPARNSLVVILRVSANRLRYDIDVINPPPPAPYTRDALEYFDGFGHIYFGPHDSCDTVVRHRHGPYDGEYTVISPYWPFNNPMDDEEQDVEDEVEVGDFVHQDQDFDANAIFEDKGKGVDRGPGVQQEQEFNADDTDEKGKGIDLGFTQSTQEPSAGEAVAASGGSLDHGDLFSLPGADQGAAHNDTQAQADDAFLAYLFGDNTEGDTPGEQPAQDDESEDETTSPKTTSPKTTCSRANSSSLDDQGEASALVWSTRTTTVTRLSYGGEGSTAENHRNGLLSAAPRDKRDLHVVALT